MLQNLIHTIPIHKIEKALQTFDTPVLNELREELSTYRHIANEKELKDYLVQKLIDLTIRPTTEQPLGFHLQITVGQGGMDAEDCTDNIWQMYLNLFTKYSISHEILHTSYTEQGLSSGLIRVTVPSLVIPFQLETGIHRTERVSPFKSNKSVQTSETYIVVYPYYATPQVTVSPKDIQITPIRSGGPGGQHANKNYTGVRLRHIPTGITITVTKHRSQHQNRQTALSILYSRLQELHEQRNPRLQDLNNLTLIRTYDFTRDQLKSHIYKLKIQNLTNILKGNLEIVLLYNILYAIYQSQKSH